VAPGFIETDMTASLTDAQREALLTQVPLKRLGKPEDVAHGVAYLLSEQASYVTGITLDINGGMYM
jgi:3-oxoacyl-[acyl-carrier protein] reductase